MEEHNKKTLIEALSALPNYEPNDELWDRIEAAAEDELFLPKNKLASLPTYEPPAALWQQIAQTLGHQSAPAKGRVVPIGWRRALAIAASLAFVVFSILMLNNQPTGAEEFSISYSTEMPDPLLTSQDWDEDEDAFLQFLEICEAKKYICEQPAFRQLQSELEELTEAKLALKEAVGDYGADAELITQIKEIELERTDLLKKMMVMLI
jgi:hypothetical protein